MTSYLPSPSQPPSASLAPTSIHGRRPRVLVVDDDERITKGIRRALERAQFQVTVASGGIAGFQAFLRDAPDLIVSDISMPDMSGVELLRKVRSRDPEVPFVLITGEPSIDSAISAVNDGALKYLTKPVDTRELRRIVTQAVGARELGKLHRRIVAATSQPACADVLQLSRRFDSAIDKLYMAFQPIVEWPSQRVFAHEALVRSAEPTMSDPGRLFQAAEQLQQLDVLWRAIRRACGAALPNAPADTLLFINLHARDLADEDLLGEEENLYAYADRIVFEVTERASMADLSQARRQVAALRRAGFRIAVDDIGSGYAGLNSFAMLEPEIVKLDMALVRDVDKSITKQRLIGSFCTMCRSMGISIIAEGIETVEERDVLAELGCELFQGYLFQKPQPQFCGETIALAQAV